MKYNIHGFYQPRAVELGLSNDDLLVLRWFVDYSGTGKMRTIILENKVYYWINYNTVLEELPVLKVSKQTLYKKHFMNLVNANVLEHKHIKEDGSFSYYCYGLNYETLLYLEGGCVKNNDPVSKFTEGGMSKFTDPLCKNLPSKDYNNNINNSIIINNKEIKKEKKQILPSSLEEVIAYAKERGREELAKDFYEFYEAGDWVDYYGNKILNWKQKFITYENKHPKPKQEAQSDFMSKVQFGRDDTGGLF